MDLVKYVSAAMVVLATACGGETIVEPPDLDQEDPPVDRCANVTPEPNPPADEVLMIGHRVEDASTMTPDRFQPIAEGEMLELEQGPQVGQHFLVSVMHFAKTDRTWRHEFEFVDPESGEELGFRWIYTNLCPPSWGLEPVVSVIVHDPATQAGRLIVRSTPKDGGRELTTEMDLRLHASWL